MSTIRAIFYDAGRTLVHPRPLEPEIWSFLSEQLRVEIPPEHSLPDVGHYYYARLGQDGLGSYDSDERARSFWISYYTQALIEAGVQQPEANLLHASNALYDWYQSPQQWQPYPEVAEALAAVERRGLLQGVISDWGTDLVPILHAHEITRHLDFVVASAAVGLAKPHPGIFRHALERSGLQPPDAIYVGDSYVADVLGARAAGIQPVLIDRDGIAPAVDCSVVTSLLDVLELVEVAA
jgi:REG-2-like HAD superfamily hydrolase